MSDWRGDRISNSYHMCLPRPLFSSHLLSSKTGIPTDDAGLGVDINVLNLIEKKTVVCRRRWIIWNPLPHSAAWTKNSMQQVILVYRLPLYPKNMETKSFCAGGINTFLLLECVLGRICRCNKGRSNFYTLDKKECQKCFLFVLNRDAYLFSKGDPKKRMSWHQQEALCIHKRCV